MLTLRKISEEREKKRKEGRWPGESDQPLKRKRRIPAVG